MLKSTYTPSAAALLHPLPLSWSEHKSPSGHTYYYNAQTKESTYTRPGGGPAPGVGVSQPAPQLNLSDPNVANAFIARHSAANANRRSFDRRDGPNRGGRGGAGGSGLGRPQPRDKPTSKFAIPGCDPWCLVFTKYGRRFVYNSAKNESYWRIPDKLKAGILELDQQRIREKAGAAAEAKTEAEAEPKAGHGAQQATVGAADRPNASGPRADGERAHDYDSSEYEEVEVTDDESGEGPDLGAEEDSAGESNEDAGFSRPKRQRTDGADGIDEPVVEFDEADIAYQLQAMGEEYGLEQGEYDDGNMEDWPEGVEGLTLSDEDARALFRDLLTDFRINPYSPWEKLVEEGKIIDDSRYTVLNTMKARKETWEEWSREKIKELREQRAKEEKKDPRIPYLAFLQERATPKLYWPEFKRKYRKEAVMRDSGLADKDREKQYREHISRLKLPQATLRSDLTALLRSLPLSKLNNQTVPTHLPAHIITDIRYISLDPQVRDPLIGAYLQTLGPPPAEEEVAREQETEALAKAKDERRRREHALEERDRIVAEEKARVEKKLRFGKAVLREEERELQQAMQVGKGGLQSQLAANRDATQG